MKENSIVFLDNPGIPLPGAAGYDETQATLQEIAKSEEKKPFVNANADNLAAELAKLDAKDYSGSRWGPKRNLTRGWLNGLYRDANIGDLIVVPSPSVIRNEKGELEATYTMVVEIVGEPERWTKEQPSNIFLWALWLT